MAESIDMSLGSGRAVGRTPSQWVAIGTAILFYVLAVGCVVALLVGGSEARSDAVKASLLASFVFFSGAGFVLHIVGSARLKGILAGTDDYVVRPSGEDRD